MSRNNFQELEHLQEERYRLQTLETQNKINSTVKVFHFIGDLVELFLPKVFQVFVKASGGDDMDYSTGPMGPNRQQDDADPKYPNTIL